MIDQVINAVITEALSFAAPFTAIKVGSLPSDDGLSIAIASGVPDEEFLDRAKTYAVSAVLNGKHSNQQTLANALMNIHTGLTQKKTYTAGADWEITDISTIGLPSYIEQESSTKQWLYGSSIQIKFYLKGV